MTTPITIQAPADTATSMFDSVFGRFDVDAAAAYLADDYIQHNPSIPDGAQGILSVIPAAQASGITAETHRVIAEGDLVVLHNTYRNAQMLGAETLVAFDVLRIENGQAVEHWDNLQAPPATTVSGRSMTDGPVKPIDLDKTAENKALVAAFIDDVFIGGNVANAANYIVAEPGAYHQHNPLVPDGLEALGAAFVALAEAGQGFSFSTLHMIVAEGDFVFTMTEGGMGEEPTAFFDLWRVADGKIVEHWDVIESIPAEMAHDNGKF